MALGATLNDQLEAIHPVSEQEGFGHDADVSQARSTTPEEIAVQQRAETAACCYRPGDNLRKAQARGHLTIPDHICRVSPRIMTGFNIGP